MTQPPAVAPPKEQAKTTSNKRTKSTKTSTKATLEQPIGKPPATQRGLLSQEEAQLIERLGTGTEEPEETGGDQVRVDHTTKEQPGLSSLKFKKKVEATWTDEDIARVIEKYVVAEKVGDKETSDTFFALYKKMATICATNRDANLREITELEQVVIDPVLPPQKSPNSPHADTCPFPNLGNHGNSVEGDVDLKDGALPRHDEMGFTPYFDTNIRHLKGPLPLTIFNKAWKNRAILYHSEKRPKFDESSSD
ncbi:hypothetical protein PSTT_16852 [Puccinia striiformis]|uniref:Uncharacterized protein n=1 Tax=Puccinia striiformis TaxID=27350 RepID=A0A2S4UAX1_9BASI|nr:hypothetical protein PSTT_16852 [Puccinia striiformis]